MLSQNRKVGSICQNLQGKKNIVQQIYASLFQLIVIIENYVEISDKLHDGSLAIASKFVSREVWCYLLIGDTKLMQVKKLLLSRMCDNEIRRRFEIENDVYKK